MTSSGSSGHTETSSAENSSPKTEETALSDKNENWVTLGCALNQTKDTSLASVEELYNLVGGGDIKVCLFIFDSAICAVRIIKCFPLLSRG